MDDFIERTLKERRTPQEALADLLAKYYRIPPNNERRALERDEAAIARWKRYRWTAVKKTRSA